MQAFNISYNEIVNKIYTSLKSPTTINAHVQRLKLPPLQPQEPG